ncbi:MAG: FAD-dependent oxidoreductase [Pseudomonadota bacterium]
MAQDLPVEWAVRAESLSREADMWRIETADRSFTANTVLVAVPAEQAHDLLSDPAATLAHIAGSVVSAPCWAVMVAFADRLAIANDAMRDPAAPISWAARNSAKPGRAGEECWVLHASPERSRELIDLPKEEVGPHLLADFFAQMSTMPVEPIHLAAHRWLYAMPASQKGEPALYETSQGIGIAGDYLHSPRVEGAWLSGNALAQRVLSAK